MKKFKFILAGFWLLSFAFQAAAEVDFRDVADDHWAKETVYSLVRMGITEGYPDGTFRGKKNITRYEAAKFLSGLSKLSRALNVRQGKLEKLIEELRAEAALIKYQRDKAAKETQFYGAIESRARFLVREPEGTKLDYHLKLNLLKNFDEDTSAKIGLDTIDAGFNTEALRTFATGLIDIEGKFRFGGWDCRVNLGPGKVLHRDDLFPSENYTVYFRPETGASAATRLGKMDVTAGYVARSVEASGRIGLNELTAEIKYKFGRLAAYLRPHYLYVLDGPEDVVVEAGFNYMLNKNWVTYALVGVGDFETGSDSVYLKLVEKIIDPLKTGTTIVLRFDKVGSGYREKGLDEFELIDLNNFNRYILDGTMDFGLKIRQKLAGGLSLEWLNDYVTAGDCKYGKSYPGTYFLWQLGLFFDISSGIKLNAYYRSYHVPSGIAQFSDPVPEISSMFGMGLKCAF